MSSACGGSACGSPAPAGAAAAPGAPPMGDRERQIAELVSAGRTNREIATQLHLSEKTVANHLTRVFTKLSIPRGRRSRRR